MTCAAILQRAGLVPVVPTLLQSAGAPDSKAGRNVPTFPVVPTQKHNGASEPANPRRVVVRFRVDSDPLGWAVCLGAPSESRADVIADLYARFGNRVEIRTAGWPDN